MRNRFSGWLIIVYFLYDKFSWATSNETLIEIVKKKISKRNEVMNEGNLEQDSAKWVSNKTLISATKD